MSKSINWAECGLVCLHPCYLSSLCYHSSFFPTLQSGLCLWTLVISPLLLSSLNPRAPNLTSVYGICFQTELIHFLSNAGHPTYLLTCPLRPVCTILPLGDISILQVIADPGFGPLSCLVLLLAKLQLGSIIDFCSVCRKNYSVITTCATRQYMDRG